MAVAMGQKVLRGSSDRQKPFRRGQKSSSTELGVGFISRWVVPKPYWRIAAFPITWIAFGQPCHAQAEPKTIELGGLRQAKAVLCISEMEYLVKLRMLAVRTFDPATNTLLNREKARAFALQALGRHLSGKQDGQFLVSGVQIESTETDGKLFTLTLRVPRNGVSMVKEQEESLASEKPAEKKRKERLVLSSSFFTRKRDYFNTLDELAGAALDDLRRSEQKARSTEKTNDTDSFYHAIAEIEERVFKNVQILAAEVKGDNLLLTIEQDELHEALGTKEREVLERLKEAVKRHKTKAAKEKSP